MPSAQPKRHWERWTRRFQFRRPRRILLLLAAVWIVQGFDLGFTLFAHECGTFAELNPAAAWAIDRGPTSTVLFKATLVVFATLILWRYRRRALSEALLWLVLGVCVGLSYRWRDYFDYFAEHAGAAPLIQLEEPWLGRSELWMRDGNDEEADPAADNLRSAEIARARTACSEPPPRAATPAIDARHPVHRSYGN